MTGKTPQTHFAKFDASGSLVTNIERWDQVDTETSKWNGRYRLMSRYVRPLDHVVDIGCASQNLRTELPAGCTYTPVDLIDRGNGCIVMDLNGPSLAPLPRQYDVGVLAGVLEYLERPERTLSWACRHAGVVVFSYASLDAYPDRRQRRHDYGWFNHLRDSEIGELAANAGLHCILVATWNRQRIYLARRGQDSEHFRG